MATTPARTESAPLLPLQYRRPLAIAGAAIVLVGVLVLGIWLGGHPSSLPGFARSALVARSDTQVVDDAIDQIASDYFRPLSRKALDSAAIAGAVASLDDRFSNYLTPAEYQGFDRGSSYTGIGIEVNAEHGGLRVAEVFDGSPAAHAGLRDGDLITAVNGRPLAGLSIDAATELIEGSPGSDVQLTVMRGTQTLHPTVTREVVSLPLVQSELKSYGGVPIGVVSLAMFQQGASGQVRQAVDDLLHQGAKAIVLDLRHNGGGLVSEAQLTASIFIPRGVIVTTRGRASPDVSLMATGDAISSAIPVAVLVDAETASASEIVTAALQDHHRAQVVGTHTFGKGVFQEVLPLSNGGALEITVGHYYTPSGRNLGGTGVSQGPGVQPNVPVAASAVDTQQGLNAALAELARAVHQRAA